MKKKLQSLVQLAQSGFNLDLVKSHPEKYEIVGLTINNNYKS